MKLEGLHHITMITADAQATVDFYAGTLGLRLVKKTVNFDQPDAYHLYFGDERGAPGSILTWFEFPGAARGRAGIGMIHLLQLGVASEAALDFWAERLAGAERGERSLRFEDPDGLALELVVADDGNPPLRAEHPEIPAEHAITGLEGARAYARSRPVEEGVLTTCSGSRTRAAASTALQGEERHFHWAYDPAPAVAGRQGAGTVHHIAWASRDEDHLAWQERVARRRRLRDRRARPRLLQVDLLPRAARRAVRDRHALAPASPSTRTRSTSARRCACRPSTSTCASSSSASLRPIANPRAARRRMSSLIHRERPADGDPAGLLVLHHGRGADEHDLLGLADVLDPERRLHVVTPRAPLQLPGWPGNHWYVVPRVGYPDPDTFHAAYRALAELPRRALGAHRHDAGADGASAASRWAR